MTLTILFAAEPGPDPRFSRPLVYSPGVSHDPDLDVAKGLVLPAYGTLPTNDTCRRISWSEGLLGEHPRIPSRRHATPSLSGRQAGAAPGPHIGRAGR